MKYALSHNINKRRLLSRVLFVLLIAFVASSINDRVNERKIFKSPINEDDERIRITMELNERREGMKSKTNDKLCETKNKSIDRMESEFKHKPGWRQMCAKKFKDSVKVRARMHFERRKDIEDDVGGVRRRSLGDEDFGEEERRGNDENYGLDRIERYARDGAKYGMFDDRDEAVGRKALAVMFSGRGEFVGKTLRRFKECETVVVTASFGAQDTLHEPVGADPTWYGLDKVCFVAFVDKPTVEKFGYGECEDVWNVVEYSHPGFPDSRMKARLVKALLPFHFPHSKVTVWVDSKLTLNDDPSAIVDVLLELNTHPRKTMTMNLERVFKYDVAVSENHVREDVFAEADKLTKMFHGALSVNETYDSDRTRWLSQTVKRYKDEGFKGRGLPDTGLFIRRTTPVGFELSIRWAHEILRAPFGRDQISFPYVKWIMEQRGFKNRIRVFEKCFYVAAVNEVGHASRSGVVA